MDLHRYLRTALHSFFQTVNIPVHTSSSSTLPTVYEGKHLQPCHKFICKTCSCCARPVMTAGFNCPEHPVCRTCLAKSMVSQIDAGKAMCSCPVEGCNVQLPEKVYSCAWLRDVTAKRRSNMQELPPQ